MSNLRDNYRIANPWKHPFIRRCTIDGEIHGAWEMTGDYSGSPVDFWIEADAGFIFVVQEVSVLLSDTGTMNFDEYGNIDGLTNGLVFFKETEGVRETVDPSLHTNVDLLLISSATQLVQLSSSERVITYHQHYSDVSDGVNIQSGMFGLTLNDNFTGLLAHGAVVSGYAVLNEAGE